MTPPELVAILLALHECAHTAALKVFQEQALELLHALIQFDSAVWGLGANASESGAYINSIHCLMCLRAVTMDPVHASITVSKCCATVITQFCFISSSR